MPFNHNTGKFRDTVSNLEEHYGLHKKYANVLLAAAHELRDDVSGRLIRAHDQIGRAHV